VTDAKNRYPITADTLGGQKITYQVGYIGFDKANQNAVVVLQNSFNWSNYIGRDFATPGREIDLDGRR
jgi:hypothetical protein